MRSQKRYVPLIEARLNEQGKKVERSKKPGGKLNGVKVHLLADGAGKAVVKVSENTDWYIFRITTDDPVKFLDDFHKWCRPAIQHAQIIRK